MTFRLYWISKDRQSWIDCGEYETQEDAEKAIPDATMLLIGRGPSDDPWITDGAFVIDEVD
jgi:hypothetical protein